MLPTQELKRSNFVDGIKFNPKLIGISQNYFNQKSSLQSLYGIGRGILVGFLDSLEVYISGGKLILKSGAAIDGDGNIIFVPKSYVITTDILVSKYKDRSTLYIYISFESKMDDLGDSRYDNDVKFYYSIIEGYQVSVSDKKMRDSKYIELARIDINHQISELFKNPLNPFQALENEINIRYAPKIVGQNIMVSLEDRDIISHTLLVYAQFLNEFALRYSIHSMSVSASFAYQISSEIKNQPLISVWSIYDKLYQLLKISLFIELERKDIVNTAFWKNIMRLKHIFSFSENLRVDYYKLILNIENSFFSKVILHFNNAVIFDGDWDNILKEKKEEIVKKDYIIIGSDPGCDMVIECEDVADKHAKVYKYKSGYMIEDMPNTSGVYVNAQRVEAGTKKFIRKQDYVVLGKNNCVVNLQNLPL